MQKITIKNPNLEFFSALNGVLHETMERVKQLIGRPSESAQPERKSTPIYDDDPKILHKVNYIPFHLQYSSHQTNIVKLTAYRMNRESWIFIETNDSLKEEFIDFARVHLFFYRENKKPRIVYIRSPTNNLVKSTEKNEYYLN